MSVSLKESEKAFKAALQKASTNVAVKRIVSNHTDVSEDTKNKTEAIDFTKLQELREEVKSLGRSVHQNLIIHYMIKLLRIVPSVNIQEVAPFLASPLFDRDIIEDLLRGHQTIGLDAAGNMHIINQSNLPNFKGDVFETVKSNAGLRAVAFEEIGEDVLKDLTNLSNSGSIFKYTGRSSKAQIAYFNARPEILNASIEMKNLWQSFKLPSSKSELESLLKHLGVKQTFVEDPSRLAPPFKSASKRPRGQSTYRRGRVKMTNVHINLFNQS